MKAHIANTNFEEELSSDRITPYIDSIKTHPVYLQLEFLPILYADPEDVILVTHLPPASFLQAYSTLFPVPKLATLEETLNSSYRSLESWGYSLALKDLSKEKNLHYPMPDYRIVKKVHSKAFPLDFAPRKAESLLLHSEEEVQKWIEKTPYPKVLKKLFSHSGRGHLVLLSPNNPPHAKIDAFLNEEFQNRLPIRAERWLEKVFEFSTQWLVSNENISLIGIAVFGSNSKGSYEYTKVGNEVDIFGEYLPFLQQHLNAAKPFLQQVSKEGYFGNMGLDALVYRENGKCALYPITEANARKTMSLAALLFQKRNFQGRMMQFSFIKKNADFSLLPSFLEENGKQFRFSRGLFWEMLD